jgi:hypothetical protein
MNIVQRFTQTAKTPMVLLDATLVRPSKVSIAVAIILIFCIQSSLAQPQPILVHVYSGWSLVSVPYIQSDPSAAAVFPGKEGSVFDFNMETMKYVPTTSLINGRGYWVYYPNATDVPINGSVPGPITLTAIQAGWILIGCHETEIELSSIELDNDAKILGGAAYVLISPSYVGVPVLKPGQGAWICITKACTITIP